MLLSVGDIGAFSRRGSMSVGRCGGDSEYTGGLAGPAGGCVAIFSLVGDDFLF